MKLNLPPLILTVRQAHKLLGGVIGLNRLYEYIQNNYIPYTIINRKIAIRYTDLVDFVETLFHKRIEKPNLSVCPTFGGKNGKSLTTLFLAELKSPPKRKAARDQIRNRSENVQQI